MESSVYSPSENIICRKIVDETLLVPIHGDLANMRRIFALDAVGEFIWRRLDGRKALEAVHEEVVEAFDVDRDRAWEDLRRFRDELAGENLIVKSA